MTKKKEKKTDLIQQKNKKLPKIFYIITPQFDDIRKS
jgi:hypothetical protein